jgi:hypothetical protein
MTFTEQTSIVYTHAPPPGQRERIGVEGRYDLSDSEAGVHLAISLTVTAELALPRATTHAVQRVMRQTMTMMGDRFSRNLLKDLAGAGAPGGAGAPPRC